MSDPVLVALVGAGAALLTGLLTLLGQRFNSSAQKQLSENADRLRRYEEWEHLLSNYRQDLDRANEDRGRLRKERDDALKRARVAERQVDEWLPKKID